MSNMYQRKNIKESPSHQIDTDGNVWSCFKRGGHGKGMIPSVGWNKLKLSVNRKGYLIADFRKKINGKKVGKARPVHQLVLEAFVGGRPEGMVEARHLDGNKLNNSVSNLAWGTSKENYADRVRHGTDNSGERAGKAKLTAEDVELIRELRRGSHLTQKRIGQIFGVHKTTIQGILNGTHWKCMGS